MFEDGEEYPTEGPEFDFMGCGCWLVILVVCLWLLLSLIFS